MVIIYVIKPVYCKILLILFVDWLYLLYLNKFIFVILCRQ